MAQSIILKRSATSGKVPTTSSLNIGEIAINTYDGKIFLNRSGSSQSIQEIITTNVTNTGSITLTQTGSFGELVVTKDTNLKRDVYVTRDIITNGSLDLLGNITGSSAVLRGNLTVSGSQTTVGNSTIIGNISTNNALLAGNLIVSGSQIVNGDINVLGAVNARQFNIGVISSSIMYTSGSNKFGDTTDDTHQFTGSVQVTGSLYVNGSQVGIAPGPNTYDFNLDPNAAGTVNYIQDSTGNSFVIAQTGSIQIKINNSTFLSVSQSAFNVTTGSITANYMHLAKYINTAGDLDFNI
jgi:hypothetical protein